MKRGRGATIGPFTEELGSPVEVGARPRPPSGDEGFSARRARRRRVKTKRGSESSVKASQLSRAGAQAQRRAAWPSVSSRVPLSWVWRRTRTCRTGHGTAPYCTRHRQRCLGPLPNYGQPRVAARPYKMALVTWAAIFPLITAIALTTGPRLEGQPLAVRLASRPPSRFP
jgi:hypothetical protein